MSLLIGISGAQGAGKTTLLSELANRGYQIDTFKVSRAVQQQLGWSSLAEVMSNPAMMMVFQTEILKQKIANDEPLKYQTDGSGILTERTFADIYAYTALWTSKFVATKRLWRDDADDFLIEFGEKCITAQQQIYDGVVLLPLMEHIVWEEDAKRASKEDAAQVFASILDFTNTAKSLHCIIKEKSVAERSAEVDSFILNNF